MIDQLTAVSFHRFLETGRTHPAIFTCEDTGGKLAGEFVVKLVGATDTGTSGLASELIASMLAKHLLIGRPKPAIIKIHPELIPWLERSQPQHADSFRNSRGLNFGTELLVDTSTWPTGRPIPDSIFPMAARVFAFDALISNDDRRRDNPNILVRGDDLFVIDHELAFSFRYLISSKDMPWQLQNRRSLQDHVFFWQLRKKAVDFKSFIGRLCDLGDAALEEIIRSIPSEWQSETLPRVSKHLIAVRDNAEKFEMELVGRLA